MEHVEDFELMNASASAEQQMLWTRMANDADQRRLTDISAMDIYNIDLPKGAYAYLIQEASSF